MHCNRYPKARLALAAAWLAASPALFAAGTGQVYVSSEDDDVVTVFDGQSLEKIDTIAVSERPRWLAFSPDHKKLYVACGDDDSIDVIDVAQGKVVDRLTDIDDPEIFAIGPDGRPM